MIGLDTAQTEAEALASRGTTTSTRRTWRPTPSCGSATRRWSGACARGARAGGHRPGKDRGPHYGYCDRCHAPIDGRAAPGLPYALLCVTCASLAEV